MNVVFERDGGMSSLWPPSSPQRSTRLPLLTNRSLLLLQNKGPKEVNQGPKWVNPDIFGNKHENIGFLLLYFEQIVFVQLSTQLQTTNFVQTLVWVWKFQSILSEPTPQIFYTNAICDICDKFHVCQDPAFWHHVFAEVWQRSNFLLINSDCSWIRRLFVVCCHHAQKPENGPFSDLFNLTQNTFCLYCLILT